MPGQALMGLGDQTETMLRAFAGVMGESAMGFLKQHLTDTGFFIVAVALITGVFYPPFLILGPDGGGAPFAVGAMFSPMMAALLTCWLYGRPIRGLGWRLGPPRLLLQSYLLPIAYLAVAFGAVWALGLSGVRGAAMGEALRTDLGMSADAGPWQYLGWLAVFVLLQSLVSIVIVIGEEVGWRGFLTPALYEQHGFTMASLITGGVWGLWHLPLIIVFHDSTAPLWYAIACFMVTITAISFVYTWYRIKSGSVWTAVLLHAAHNAFLNDVFLPMNLRTGLSDYMIGEYGAALAVVSVALALWFWARQRTVTQHNGPRHG